MITIQLAAFLSEQKSRFSFNIRQSSYVQIPGSCSAGSAAFVMAEIEIKCADAHISQVTAAAPIHGLSQDRA